MSDLSLKIVSVILLISYAFIGAYLTEKESFVPKVVGICMLTLFIPLFFLDMAILMGDFDPRKTYEKTEPVCPFGYETYYYNHGVRCRREVNPSASEKK